MKNTINQPFSVSYTISFSGKTKSDGVKTLTPQMVRDKIMDVLETMLRSEYIEEYSVSAQINHRKKKTRGAKE